MKQYSFSEVAGILGTTKNTIKSRSKKLPSDLLIKEDGKLFVGEDGLKWFRTDLKERPVKVKNQFEPVEPPHKDPHGDPVGSDQSDRIAELEKTIIRLETELRLKDELIKRLDADKKDLSDRLTAQQGINAQTILLLGDGKKSWFSRVFHRNK